MTDAKLLTLPEGKQIEAILQALTPSRLDPTFSVLKAHLLVEEFLSEYIAAKVGAPQYLSGARLTFVQKLALARSMSPRHADEFTWDWLAKLNTIRNELAHKRDSDAAKQKISQFVAEAKKVHPMPDPAHKVETASIKDNWGNWYTELDMALMMTCSVAALILGLDVAGRLPPLAQQEPFTKP